MRLSGGVLRFFATLPVVSHLLLVAARRSWLPRRIIKSLPTARPFKVQVASEGSFEYVPSPMDHIGSLLYWGGVRAFEPETVGVFYELVKNAKTVVDVGANTGLYSMIACAANPEAQVIAFEPVPRIFELLQTNIEHNGFSSRCELHQKAVGSSIGQATLHVPYSPVPTSASLHANGFRNYSGDHIDVETTTLDCLYSDRGPVDLLKIDVEGFEHHVLLGMEQMLLQSQPAIVLECNPDGPCEHLTNLLRPHGYRFFHLRSEGLVELSAIRPDENSKSHFRNFLCSTALNASLAERIVNQI